MSVKTIHILCASLTFLFFSLRGVWMLMDSPLLNHKVVKISPHIIDTCLLATGLLMAISISATFYTQSWIMTKLLGVICYIIIGSIALKYGRTKTVRAGALVVAWGIFVYIVLVARTHSPVPYY